MVSKQSWMWFSLLFFFLFSLETSWTTLGCLEQERLALLELKPFFNNPFYLHDWVEDDHNSDCCSWERVECNHTTGRVIELSLGYLRNEDLGEWYLNASLFSPFQELQQLSLWDNHIAGCVENEGFDKLSTLSNLERLNLYENNFNSSILSSISTLSSLMYLGLSYNEMKGIIDLQELGSHNHLRSLEMSGNEIDEIVFPKGAKFDLRLSNLEDLRLDGNSLNNSILSSLSGLPSLKALSLSDTGLKGVIDFSEIYDSLSNLEMLDVSNNQINKFVVKKGNRASLRNLQSLYMRNVSIHDGNTLLQSLGLFPSLKELDLSYNNFSGLMSTPELHNSTYLEELYMYGSSLHISLLQNIAAFTSLESLVMANCQLNGISGTHGLSNLKNLKSLGMFFNLDTSVLQSIGNLTSLEHLSLRGCKLEGTGPGQLQGLCELAHLQHLDLSYNDLTGSLPWCFANLTSLQALYISSNHFSGNISSSPLQALTSIQYLRLSDNHFQIPISLEPFFNHSKLKTFYSDNNKIYADTETHSLTPKFQLNSVSLSCCGEGVTFPKFLYLQHDLEEVDLSHINLEGKFPNWLLDNNTNLRQLRFANNSLEGSLQLPTHPHINLTSLDISDNLLDGKISMEVGAYLPNLYSLNMSINHFDGSIPSSIGDMKSLDSLDLSDNILSGNVPQHLAKNCINLEYLALSNNSLDGQLFSVNFNLVNLLRLQLDGNQFIGKLPDSLSNSSNLMRLYLSDNHFTGKVPHWLGNMWRLIDLVIRNNHLEGQIPQEFCQLENLEVLDIAENSISGSLPYCFSPPGLEQVHLARNKLQGELNDALYNSSSLVTLDLGYNHLNGSIPNWINRLSNLSYLILSQNNLEGEVPIQLCQLEKLRLIDLSHNHLYGKVPSCLDKTALQGDYQVPLNITDDEFIGAPSDSPKRNEESLEFTTKNISYSYQGRILAYISGIDLSCNKLSGEIPYQIGNLTRIQTMNLSHNNLTGQIPATFSNLEQIESLDLSFNNLNGKIPSQIVKLNRLAIFSVAYNNLSDKTPEMVAQFATFEESSYRGNHLLCGPPLPKSCNATGSPPLIPKASDNEDDDNFMYMNIFYISFVVSYTIVILTIVIVLYVNPYWRRRWFYLVETWMISSYYFIVDHLPRRFHH